MKAKLIQAAIENNDFDYADYIKSNKTMSIKEIAKRLAFYSCK